MKSHVQRGVCAYACAHIHKCLGFSSPMKNSSVFAFALPMTLSDSRCLFSQSRDESYDVSDGHPRYKGSSLSASQAPRAVKGVGGSGDPTCEDFMGSRIGVYTGV